MQAVSTKPKLLPSNTPRLSALATSSAVWVRDSRFTVVGAGHSPYRAYPNRVEEVDADNNGLWLEEPLHKDIVVGPQIVKRGVIADTVSDYSTNPVRNFTLSGATITANGALTQRNAWYGGGMYDIHFTGNDGFVSNGLWKNVFKDIFINTRNRFLEIKGTSFLPLFKNVNGKCIATETPDADPFSIGESSVVIFNGVSFVESTFTLSNKFYFTGSFEAYIYDFKYEAQSAGNIFTTGINYVGADAEIVGDKWTLLIRDGGATQRFMRINGDTVNIKLGEVKLLGTSAISASSVWAQNLRLLKIDHLFLENQAMSINDSGSKTIINQSPRQENIDASGGSGSDTLYATTEVDKKYLVSVEVNEAFDGNTTTTFEVGDGTDTDAYITTTDASTVDDTISVLIDGDGNPISINWTNTSGASAGSLIATVEVI